MNKQEFDEKDKKRFVFRSMTDLPQINEIKNKNGATCKIDEALQCVSDQTEDLMVNTESSNNNDNTFYH